MTEAENPRDAGVIPPLDPGVGSGETPVINVGDGPVVNVGDAPVINLGEAPVITPGDGAGSWSGDGTEATDGIGGMSSLKGLILYGATLTFAGLYVYFMVKIFGASPGVKPRLSGATVATAAALAGVLGSAFALEIGTPTHEHETNPTLKAALETRPSGVKGHKSARVWRALSLEPCSTQAASWPKTFGIWAYAVVATAVAITYVVNQNETPDAIKGLAVAFAGYVITLINAAYKAKGR
ncbi:MAG: hypothetical protein QOF77_1711 [Solirubrobacteraceae bacterium]|jgi:hypothetical protein|nr:hypothetical protein [Solirubrobacteraceae bacterium]